MILISMFIKKPQKKTVFLQLIKNLRILSNPFPFSPFYNKRNCVQDPEIHSFLSSLFSIAVHDATGKFTSGLLNGNINQHGDFDECLGVEVNDDPIPLRGQYCLAYAQPNLPHSSPRLRTFYELMQSHEPFHSEFNDVRGEETRRERERKREEASFIPYKSFLSLISFIAWTSCTTLLASELGYLCSIVLSTGRCRVQCTRVPQ